MAGGPQEVAIVVAQHGKWKEEGVREGERKKMGEGYLDGGWLATCRTVAGVRWGGWA